MAIISILLSSTSHDSDCFGLCTKHGFHDQRIKKIFPLQKIILAEYAWSFLLALCWDWFCKIDVNGTPSECAIQAVLHLDKQI
jgi:hypothetical protein